MAYNPLTQRYRLRATPASTTCSPAASRMMSHARCRCACCSTSTARWPTARPTWRRGQRPARRARPGAAAARATCARMVAPARAACRRRPSASRPAMPRFEALRDAFLGTTRPACSSTRLFDGMRAELLQRARSARPALGHRHQQVDALHRAARRGARPARARGLRGLRRHHAALKPHPAPLLRRRAATRRSRRAHCVYLGDDLRDVQAARAAGMATLVAAWGYLGARAEPSREWGADACLRTPASTLLNWLRWPKIAGSGADLVSTWVRIRRRACRAPVRS